mgnify:CR=1 FL=1
MVINNIKNRLSMLERKIDDEKQFIKKLQVKVKESQDRLFCHKIEAQVLFDDWKKLQNIQKFIKNGVTI